jgi:serine-type D-Ala-D-Ala carboxypeptidase
MLFVQVPFRSGWPVRALVSALVLGGIAVGISIAGSQPREQGEALGAAAVPGEEVRMTTISPAALLRVQEHVSGALEQRAFPGAGWAVGVRDQLHGAGAAGRHEWSEQSAPVSADSTLYDLASLTKAVATTTAVMLLVEDGKFDLDQPVQRFLPNFQGQFKERVTFRHLLTHTSGLPAGTRLNGRTPDEVLRRLQGTLIPVPPGTQTVYSDIGFAVLWAAASQAAGEPLPAMLRRRVWEPLGMTQTRFVPGAGCEKCAPTLHLERGARTPYRGMPADMTARRLGGIAGNAGLFSTTADLARFAAMMASGGELDGVRILSGESVGEILRQQPGAGDRTLGWEAYCPAEEKRRHDPCALPVAYGHTGYTGTSLFVDPQSGRWAVLLSNRTYLPRSANRMRELRAGLWNALAE